MTDSSKKPFFVRIPIKVAIKDAQTGETILRTSSTKKSKVRADITEFLAQNANLDWVGVCKVTYNRQTDYWNEFEFTTYETFDRSLKLCTQKELLLELAADGTLDKRFLEKRKLSTAQLAVLAKNGEVLKAWKEKNGK